MHDNAKNLSTNSAIGHFSLSFNLRSKLFNRMSTEHVFVEYKKKFDKKMKGSFYSDLGLLHRLSV